MFVDTHKTVLVLHMSDLLSRLRNVTVLLSTELAIALSSHCIKL